MKAVIQRVENARLSVGGEEVCSIGFGLVVYLGIEQADAESNAVAFAQKLTNMRIFSDDAGKMNLSVRDVGGDILIVSNFTLCADISHGNRPSFTNAMRPPLAASVLFDYCADVVEDCMRDTEGNVARGIFGADMVIEQTNIGPVTIIY
ncbi:MAG: D-tyrosyl-tRNA(Tyr) deacylase [Clostridiales bacterium]|nr:D-tyrosyl-tRNA(Tyr) deacylase [Clostridiales bacterium]